MRSETEDSGKRVHTNGRALMLGLKSISSENFWTEGRARLPEDVTPCRDCSIELWVRPRAFWALNRSHTSPAELKAITLVVPLQGGGPEVVGFMARDMSALLNFCSSNIVQGVKKAPFSPLEWAGVSRNPQTLGSLKNLC